MDLVTKYLTFVTSLDKVVTIDLHGCPIITSPKDLFGHGRAFSMYTFTTLIDGPYDRAFFVSINASEQHRIIIPLLHHIPIQEELSTKYSQILIITDGCFLGILLFFQMCLDVIEPRLIVRFGLHF